MRGGYKLIDLKGIDLVTSAAAKKIDGIYDAIESTRKPIILTGCVFDGVETADQHVNFGISSGNYVAEIPAGTLTITNYDMVTLS